MRELSRRLREAWFVLRGRAVAEPLDDWVAPPGPYRDAYRAIREELDSPTPIIGVETTFSFSPHHEQVIDDADS